MLTIKFKLIIGAVLVAVVLMSWSELRDLIVTPNNDGSQIFRVTDKDGNPRLSVNTVTDAVEIPAGTELQFRDSGADITSGTSGRLDLTATTIRLAGNLEQGTGFWARAPLRSNDMSVAYFYEEDFIGTPQVVTTNALEGWKTTADASYVIAHAAGSLGGLLSITPVTGSNNEIYMQLGEIGTETFVEFTAASGKEVWFEARITTDAVTDAGDIFVGLASTGMSAGNFINDAGNDFADGSFVGFVIWEAAPSVVQYVHQTTTTVFADVTTGVAMVAGTYQTLGIHFDGGTSVEYYVNGTLVATVLTSVAGFPDTIEFSPLIAVKNGAQDKTLFIDWIKLVAER